jgi:integrase
VLAKASEVTIPISPKKYWDSAWKSLTRAAGLERFRFHDLRHTFITHMVELGIPIGVVQAMVGHISSRMLRHYTHIARHCPQSG